jgi:hypothetical protein
VNPGVKDIQMLDAEAIFSCRIIENFPDLMAKQSFVVLKHDENVAYAPLMPGTLPKVPKVKLSIEQEIRKLEEEKKAKIAEKMAAKLAKAAGKGKKKSKKKTWWERGPKKWYVYLTGGPAKFGKAVGSEETMLGDVIGADECNFTKQPRYAMGHCFVGSAITYLVAGTYYNPTIPHLLELFAEKDFLIINVSPPWIGREYGLLFEHLLKEKDLLTVGIFRKTKPEDGEVPNPPQVEGAPPPGFIYTAPPMLEIMMKQDKLLCMLAEM